MRRVIISADTAFKVSSQSDYSAIQVWGEVQTGFYLLAAWKGRVEYPELKRVLISFAEQWKPNEVLIEDAASGQSLIQELRASTSLPIKAIKVDRDKVSRAESCTGMLEAGRVYLPADAPWLNDFLDELSAFPQGAHDDQVDACTMALNYLRGQNSVLGIIELLKKGWDGFTNTFKSPEPSAPAVAVAQITDTQTTVGPSPMFTGPNPAPCTACGSNLIVRCSGQIRCNACGAQRWENGAPKSYSPNRRDFITGNLPGAKTFRFPGQR
jgi:predicted phage terminase large subunit-like protein